MSTAAPLMPKATAVWLLDNTALSFDQIADFCKLHPLEVKAIADGDSAQGIKGLDPITTGQLTREQITAAEADHSIVLKLTTPKVAILERARAAARKARATRRCRAARTGRTPFCGWCAIIPNSRTPRSCGWSAPPSRPFPAIRDRTHWNAANLAPMDPVTLGLCLADRPRSRSLARQQGKAAARRHRRDAAAGRPRPPRARRPKSPPPPKPSRTRGRRHGRQRRVRQAQADRRQGRTGRRRVSVSFFPLPSWERVPSERSERGG